MFYVILNTRKSNFAMRVNFITRTFHAAALARKLTVGCDAQVQSSHILRDPQGIGIRYFEAAGYFEAAATATVH